MATKKVALSPGTNCVHKELKLHLYRPRLHKRMSAVWTAALQVERSCITLTRALCGGTGGVRTEPDYGGPGQGGAFPR